MQSILNGPLADSKPCDENPCLNGGTCLNFGKENYICRCPSGIYGRHCEHGMLVYGVGKETGKKSACFFVFVLKIALSVWQTPEV